MEPLQESSRQPKKHYEKPDIRVYGDLRAITQSSGNKSTHADHPFYTPPFANFRTK
jgi:hypothetical protein